MTAFWQMVHECRQPELTATGDAPAAIREARAFAALLARIPIGIPEEDLIAGDFGPSWIQDKAAHHTPAAETAAVTAGQTVDPWILMDQRFHMRAGYTAAHTTVDYPRVLHHGLRGILDHVQRRHDAAADGPRRVYLEAMNISLNAVIDWAHRFATLARAGAHRVGVVDERLLQMANACDRVPEHPPRSFLEVVQSV